MKFQVATLSVLALTLAAGPLIASAADAATSSMTQHHTKHYHVATHGKQMEHKRSSESRSVKPK